MTAVYAPQGIRVSTGPAKPLPRVPRVGSVAIAIVALALAEPTDRIVQRSVPEEQIHHAQTKVSAKEMAHAHASMVSPEMIAV